MEYTELIIGFNRGYSGTERLIALLSLEGFEGFREEDDRLLAYIPSDRFSMERLNKKGFLAEEGIRSVSFGIIPETNWNEVWESGFHPVEIAGRVYVRAPFHEKRDGFEFDLIIEPKMSFGTAHHETTGLMMEMLLDMDLADKDVADAGCGTGILAILAEKLGSRMILAFDNDEWAYRNALENTSRNGCRRIRVVHGDASQLKATTFDCILANINRNVLIRDIHEYTRSLGKGGHLLMSGFLQEDRGIIDEAACKEGLHIIRERTRNSWVAVGYEKN
ncbi:MAG: 50S ribosomal protein L11 methyltransferase [Bacteroidales bacterium]|nr:50S ribosomal protein L11 methyltransferase [Bacteroidales bacterium]